MCLPGAFISDRAFPAPAERTHGIGEPGGLSRRCVARCEALAHADLMRTDLKHVNPLAHAGAASACS
jgi:hypothetical protein